MDFALSSLDMFDDMSENLLNFAFNVGCVKFKQAIGD